MIVLELVQLVFLLYFLGGGDYSCSIILLKFLVLALFNFSFGDEGHKIFGDRHSNGSSASEFCSR